MRFAHIAIQSVRNLTEATLECHPGCNVIYGRNAAGKTAILEAIHILSRANSFRTPRIADVIQHSQEKLTVFARFIDRDENLIKTGIERGLRETQIRYADKKVSHRSHQASNVPLLTLTPDSPQILFGSPRERRHWLDWSLFHVEPGYIAQWQAYHHALRQRNVLLRDRASDSLLLPWEKALSKRLAHANSMEGGLDVCLNYLTSVPETTGSFREKLAQQRSSDRQIGHTQLGPHRDDVRFLIHGYAVAGDILSRGQGKRLLLSLIQAQTDIYRQQRHTQPIILIDDLPSELDQDACQEAIKRLEEQGVQVFLTATQPEILGINGCRSKAYGMFHVEHGRVIKMVE